MTNGKPQPVAAVMLMTPDGRTLMLHRADTDDWRFPCDQIGEGWTAEAAAWRALFRRTQCRCGSISAPMMRCRRDGVDAVTYLCPAEEFTPQLDSAHDAFQWMRPTDVLAASKTG